MKGFRISVFIESFYQKSSQLGCELCCLLINIIVFGIHCSWKIMLILHGKQQKKKKLLYYLILNNNHFTTKHWRKTEEIQALLFWVAVEVNIIFKLITLCFWLKKN